MSVNPLTLWPVPLARARALSLRPPPPPPSPLPLAPFAPEPQAHSRWRNVAIPRRNRATTAFME